VVQVPVGVGVAPSHRRRFQAVPVAGGVKEVLLPCFSVAAMGKKRGECVSSCVLERIMRLIC